MRKNDPSEHVLDWVFMKAMVWPMNLAEGRGYLAAVVGFIVQLPWLAIVGFPLLMCVGMPCMMFQLIRDIAEGE